MSQKLKIPNKHGEKLAGVLHDAGSQDIVLVCHGFRRSKDDVMMVNIATALADHGITAFRFDFSGNGESEGSSSSFMSEVDDVRSVVDYFAEARHATIAVVGHSKGGKVVLLYASRYHDIPAVVNISSSYDPIDALGNWLGKDFRERIAKDGYVEVVSKRGEVACRITQEILKELLDVNMDEAGRSIDKNCKVLTVHGSADEVNPMEDAYRFSNVIPNHRLEIIQGADHSYSLHQHQLVSVVLSFIKERVQATATPPFRLVKCSNYV